MLRDKTYVRTDHGMLFNVTGYEHLPNFVFASLKYIHGKKWTHGYNAAKRFLEQKHPQFVDEYIGVPLDRICTVFTPQSRWAEMQTTQKLSALHQEALTLGRQLSSILRIPLSEFGITDSLLWGGGHVDSDIDLVVMGLKNAERVLRCGHTIYEHPGFERPSPSRMKAPYSLDVANWPELLSRKLHMGCYQNRLFSLRAVLNDDELPKQPIEAPGYSATTWNEVIQFEIADASRSLLFPSTYRNALGNELVDYSVVYEGVFRAGEAVRCRVSRETLPGTQCVRYTVLDTCELVG